MVRYACGFLVAIIGGLAGPIAADAIGASGLAAYGLFLAGVAVFVPIAAVVGGGPPARRLHKPLHR